MGSNNVLKRYNRFIKQLFCQWYAYEPNYHFVTNTYHMILLLFLFFFFYDIDFSRDWKTNATLLHAATTMLMGQKNVN